MRALVVTGTDTGVGKTRVASAIAGALRREGRRVGVLKPVATGLAVQQLIAAVRGVLVTAQVKEYIIALCAGTRSAPELRLCASPRAALQLLRASRARAALDGRDYVIPDDIQALAVPVLGHRLLPTAEAQVERKAPSQVVARLVEQIPLPRPLSGGRA